MGNSYGGCCGHGRNPMARQAIFGGNNPAVPLGEIFTDDFHRALIGTDYTTNATASIVSNELSFSGNAAGDFSKYIFYNAYVTNLEDWTITVRQKIGTINATSYGLGIGINGSVASVQGYLFQSTAGGRLGALGFYYKGTDFLQENVDLLPLSTNDIVEITMTREKNVYTITAENITQGVTKSYSYTVSLTYPTTPAALFTDSVGKVTLYNIGGTQTIQELTYSSNSILNRRYLFFGDSITAGAYCAAIANRFSNLSFGASSIIAEGSPGATSANLITLLPEIISLGPEKVILEIGINDVANAVANATTVANIVTIINALVAEGINVIVCKPTPVAGLDIAALITAMAANATIAPRLLINFYDTLRTGTSINALYDAGDGVHINAAGQVVMAAQVIAAT